MANERSCFVCAYAETGCDRAELVGRLLGLTPELQGGTLRLGLADGSEADLILRPPWQQLVGDLERHGLAGEDAERPVSLAAYHLERDPSGQNRWLAGPEGLVVLEPEWLEDVTSLTRTQYCERYYLIDKFRPDAANEAILRGNLAHATFRQIVASPRDNDLLQRALAQALRANAITLAALEVDPDEAREAVLPALRKLVRWVRNRGPAGEVRSETFLLAHRLGMRGRIDAAWERDGRIETVAELKSGADWNGRGRVADELQVGAYGLMLAERGVADLRQERLLLLYAGNADYDGRPDLERQVPFRARTFANLVHFRNRLVLIDLTGQAAYQRQNRCRPCPLKQECHHLTELLEEPRCAAGCVLGKACPGERTFDDEERAFFRRWVGLLDREWRALNDATARLWRTDPATRCADGSAAGVVEVITARPLPDSTRPYQLRLDNECEIRQGDRVLLSDGDGPASGRVAQVEVLEVGDGAMEVLASEPLRFRPRWVDQYGSDRLFLRAYAGLYSWLAEPPERRSLVTRLRPPRFDDSFEQGTCPSTGSGRTGEAAGSGPAPASGNELNERQGEALALALRARDYLLVQGPPGSGKTEVVAELARRLTDRGQRVLLVSGTNRALDRLLEACSRRGIEERCVRLGRRAEPASAGERRLLGALVGGPGDGETQRQSDGETEGGARDDLSIVVKRARELLFGSPIVGATLATLGSGAYAGLRGQFDTIVVDEATQVSLPALLGALGFAGRFVLVGDHCQLPPVVQGSPPDDGPGLAASLFEHLAEARAADGRPGLVRLEEQYRMNAEICAFPSRAWYDGKLRPAAGVGSARLALRTTDPSAGSGQAGRATTAVELSVARLLDLERPVVFVNVPGSTTNAPRSNRREARLARLIVEAARAGGLLAGDMAVIAPFRAQVALIRSELARSTDPELRMVAHELVDTVDRFQGSERSLVVYSFATYARELHPLILDERRLNVALTRAKHKLVLLGDLQVLRGVPRFAELEVYCRGLYADRSGVLEWNASEVL